MTRKRCRTVKELAYELAREVIMLNGAASCDEIHKYIVMRHRNCPTKQALANYLRQSPEFERIDPPKGVRSSVYVLADGDGLAED